MARKNRLRAACAILVPVTALCLATNCGCRQFQLAADSPEPTAARFGVAEEHGERTTVTGDRIRYSLFLPEEASSTTQVLSARPTLVLAHGFARHKRFHAATAWALAERGYVVLTPNLISLLGGEEARTRNIASLADHVRWLHRRAADPADTLFGLVDVQQIALVGHSAGAAISFEAALQLSGDEPSVRALVLLDGVPWERTLARGGELSPLSFASFRSEPSACNAEGAVLDLLPQLSFPTADILVVGASHCDPENPTDLLCRFACGETTPRTRDVYQELLLAFLQDALQNHSAEGMPNFWALVEQLQADGEVQVAPVGEQRDDRAG